MACHVTKLNNINKLPTIQKLIILVNSNLKAFQTVDCTCTILSISDKSRFTSTHIWSTCIITRGLLVASARACAAFINIYRKIRKKEIKKMNQISAKDISILVSIKEPWDPGSPQKPQFLRNCKYKCFSGGTFQLRYYFWTLLAATLLSIQHMNCCYMH